MEKRIVHITTVHRWDDTRIFRKECQSLAAAGYDVTLVAPCTRSHHESGVRIVALPQYQRRTARMVIGAVRALCTALKYRADVYHLHDPELLGVAITLKLLGKKVIYDVHENVSAQIRSKHWIPPLLRSLVSRCFRGVERLAARCVNGVVAATPAIARQFPPEKTVIVQNFPIVGELDCNVKPGDEQSSSRIAYVGAISRERGVHNVVEALGKVRHSDARLTLAGRFSPPQIETDIRNLPAWKRVDFLGWCVRAQVADLLANATMGVVTFLPAPNHIESQPNKLFEYMSAGLPVVVSDFPLWREIVTESKCGLVVDPEDPRAIAAAFDWLLDHPDEARAMGCRARQAVFERYNWDHEFAVLSNFYLRTLNLDHAFAERGAVKHAA